MEQVHFEPVKLRRLIKVLDDVQATDSICCGGERTAAMVLSKSQKELSDIFTSGKTDDGTLDKIVEVLVAAEESLKARGDLVTSALARIALVTGATEQE